MLNVLIMKSHPFCVYVASTVGNVQVIKIRGVHEWTLSWCLGALIRNGMGLCLYFLFLTYYFMNLSRIDVELSFMRFYIEALVPKII